MGTAHAHTRRQHCNLFLLLTTCSVSTKRAPAILRATIEDDHRITLPLVVSSKADTCMPPAPGPYMTAVLGWWYAPRAPSGSGARSAGSFTRVSPSLALDGTNGAARRRRRAEVQSAAAAVEHVDVVHHRHEVAARRLPCSSG
jgi:hypothetical protein